MYSTTFKSRGLICSFFIYLEVPMWYEHWFEYFLKVKGMNAAASSMSARRRADEKPSKEILAQVQVDDSNVVYMPF